MLAKPICDYLTSAGVARFEGQLSTPKYFYIDNHNGILAREFEEDFDLVTTG
jgi:hypothetical protein